MFLLGTSMRRFVRFGSSQPDTAMSWFKVLLLMLTIGAFIPLRAQSAPPNEQPRTVHGVVVNAVTGAPIPRALVRSVDDRLAGLTNGSGEFEFTLPQPDPNAPAAMGGSIYTNVGPGRPFRFGGDQFWITASKPGFFEDANGRQAIRNNEGEIAISLVPEALIKGRVTLSTGDAASGVTVQIYLRSVMDGLWQWLPRGEVRTNSAGEFRFAELQAGSYKLVTHEYMDNDPLIPLTGGQVYGFPPVYYPGAPDLASAAIIELAAGQTVEANVALVRQPYYRVRIPVAGASVSGLSVTVEGQHGPGYSLGYSRNGDGITGLLPNGNYVVEATNYGMNALTSGKVNLTVSGRASEGPTMTLVPGSSISFDVKTEFSSNQPAPEFIQGDGKHTYHLHGPRAYLNPNLEPADRVERRGGASIRPPQGPNDDSLVMENVLPGRYWVQLNPTQGYVASATMGTTDVMREPIVIDAGSNLQIEVKLRDDFAEVDGSLANPGTPSAASESEGPSAGTWVYFVPLPDRTGQVQQVYVSSDGKFSLQGIAPGTYRVLAFASQQPNLPYRDPVGMKAYETKGQVITLSPGQKATIQVQALAGAE